MYNYDNKFNGVNMVLRFRAYSRSNRDIDEVLQSGALRGHQVNEPIIILGDTITDSQYKLREVYTELSPYIVKDLYRTSDSFSIEVKDEDAEKLKNKYGFIPAGQTMKIAHREVSMSDMFHYPEKIRELKEYEALQNMIYSKIYELRRENKEPSAILVSPKFHRLIQSSGDYSAYCPSYHRENSMTDSYMGLTLAIPAGQVSNDYCKVI